MEDNETTKKTSKKATIEFAEEIEVPKFTYREKYKELKLKNGYIPDTVTVGLVTKYLNSKRNFMSLMKDEKVVKDCILSRETYNFLVFENVIKDLPYNLNHDHSLYESEIYRLVYEKTLDYEKKLHGTYIEY